MKDCSFAIDFSTNNKEINGKFSNDEIGYGAHEIFGRKIHLLNWKRKAHKVQLKYFAAILTYMPVSFDIESANSA